MVDRRLMSCGASVAAIVVGIAAATPTAAAAAARIQVEIRPGRLDLALMALSRSSGEQIIFAKTLVDSRTTPGLAGHYTADEALQLLLRDTGLTFQRSGAGVWMILPRPAVKKTAVRFLGAVDAAPPAAPVVAAQTVAVEEVVVTARRREENLQSVPVAETAFSATALAEHNVTSVTELGQLTPSLNFHASSYGVLGVNVAIRGQMPTDLDLTQTPSIGVYVDDVYQVSTMGLGALGLTDAASVEVLKGPQGTLYGRNTTGGALKITTTLPDYDQASGILRLAAGNEDERRGFGAVSVPVLPGRVALRLVASYDKNRGYGRDLQSNTDIADTDTRAVRAVLRMQVTDKFEAIARADTLTADSGGMLYTLRYVAPGGPLNLITAFQLGQPFTAAGLGSAYNYLQANYVDEAGNDRRYNGPLYQHVVQSTGSLALRYQLNDDLALRSITAVQKIKNNIAGDNDGTPFQTVDGNFENMYIWQTTQEFQAVGDAIDHRLNYTLGYYYYRMRGDEPSFANVLYPLLQEQVLNKPHLLDESNSGYAQATFKVAPRLRLTGGLRYTRETVDLISENQLGFPSGPVCNVPVADRINGECRAHFTNANSDWSYTAGVDWDAREGVLLYLKTSRGFKAGGINQRGTVDGGFNTFLPEQVTDYEAGLKSEFWEHRARLNVAAYHSKYDNIQRTVLVKGAAGAPATAVQNAASAKIDGLEAEFTLVPVERLTLQASGAYTHAKYDRYIDPFSGADLSYREFAGTPRWQGSLSARYEHPLPMGSLTGVVDLTWQSRINFDPDNNLPPSADLPSGTAPFTSQNAYALVNARLDLNLSGPDMQLSLWGRNLTDKRYFSGGKDYSGTLGMANEIVGQPRTYGVELTKRF